ncbi:hypothetical protein P7K49_039277, partial [Saguinus oedipus]
KLGSLALADNVPEPASVCLPVNSTFAVGTAPPGGTVLPNNNDKLPQQKESLLPTSPSHLVLPPAYTHPHSGCPGQPHPAAGARRE